MNRKSKYADMERFKKTKQEQQRRYYARTQNAENGRKPWTSQEDVMVRERKVPDSKLSGMIGRSVGAIQTRRYELRKSVRD